MTASRTALCLLALCVACAAPAAGQLLPGISLSLEVRPLLGVPVGEFANSAEGIGATAGPGIAAGGSLGLGPLSVYGEYQYLELGCDDCRATGLEDSAEDQGWEAGVELGLPIPLVGLRPWGRAGVIGHQLVFAGADGKMVSEPGIGWAAGGGLAIPLGLLEITPAVRYRNYSAEFEFSDLDLPRREAGVSYLTLELGVGIRL